MLLQFNYIRTHFYLDSVLFQLYELMSISFTQYDCSSADINPIGSISKQDLRSFLRWAATHLGYSSLADIEAAPPTAELEPIRANYSQVMDLILKTVGQRCKLKG